MPNSFGSQATLQVGDRMYAIHRLAAVYTKFPQAARLPFSLKVLLENLLRCEDGVAVKPEDVEALAKWDAQATPDKEISFMPARVLLQDFTGVPTVVDLAAMRDAMQKMGGDPKKINPLLPAELVIDHSVQVDEFGTADAFRLNAEIEFERNRERYVFLRWGQKAFRNFKVVPPDTGIVHQVNLEYLARVVFVNDDPTPTGGNPWAYPDTVVGTDSHTTMVNGLGVLGWGVGGIEAEASMLGQPVSMLIPQVVGFKLTGKLREGATATDLVLTVTEILRKKGVVGKFVEYFGDGLPALTLADRATIANMAPEYGATCGIFPVDAETLRYLRFTGRSEEQVKLVEAYCKEQGLFHDGSTAEAVYSDVVALDLSTVEPCLAGPSRPQDRVPLTAMKQNFAENLPKLQAGKKKTESEKKGLIRLETEIGDVAAAASVDGGLEPVHDTPEKVAAQVKDGSVVIAAITSCTNTSNPSVLVAAGLVAKKAAEKGLTRKPWVKTSLAPGSKAVTEYLQESGLLRSLEQQGFFLVGYGCTTCIGNSGPLPPAISKQIEDKHLVVSAVLSGNRNFEGRVHPEVRANYLASPPLVVAYALAGRVDFDWEKEPIGNGVYLKDIWPTQKEINDTIDQCLKSDMFKKVYGQVYEGDAGWRSIDVPEGDLYLWPESTYVKHPPYFENMPKEPAPITDIRNARVLALLGDSITTDHISPAGSIKKDSPAGKYLLEQGVEQKDFNSYGARRGNHEVMVRGTFANTRIKNQLAPGTEGGVTRHLPDGKVMSIFDAAMLYEKEGIPLVVMAGKEYGSGSSRDWAAKGPRLQGVRAVIAESYERIHRSNLVGMGVLPLQYKPGDTAASLGLNGEEIFTIEGLNALMRRTFKPGSEVMVKARKADDTTKEFRAQVRIDTPNEMEYYRHGGILQYVLRQLVKRG